MPTHETIIILGASGMLGNTIYRYFRDNTSHRIVGLSRNPIKHPAMYQTKQATLSFGIDVDNIDAIVNAFNIHKPSIVINCIGVVKQRENADDPISVLPINSLLPHRLSALCDMINARFIHISTDCVFSGTKGMYTEKDIPDAYDLYGRSKLLGEVMAPHAVTIRTSLIGHELNTNRSLVDWFLSQSGTVFGYRNAIFSGLPTIEISYIIDKYILPNPSIHGLAQVSAEPITKYELLCIIKDVYKANVVIKPDDRLIIDRSLDSSRFRRLVNYKPPKWEDLVTKMYEYH